MNEAPKMPSQGILIIAYSLIAVGGFLIAFVLSELYAAYTDLASNKFIVELTKEIMTQPLISDSTGSMTTLGAGGAKITSLIIFSLFTWICVSIAIALIRAGIQIISPHCDELLEQIKQRLNFINQWNNNSR